MVDLGTWRSFNLHIKCGLSKRRTQLTNYKLVQNKRLLTNLMNIDECDRVTDNSYTNATCINTFVSFLCFCNKWYDGYASVCTGEEWHSSINTIELIISLHFSSTLYYTFQTYILIVHILTTMYLKFEINQIKMIITFHLFKLLIEEKQLLHFKWSTFIWTWV